MLDTLNKQKVAGTIILNDHNGQKKFLLKKQKNHNEFVMTYIEDDLTSLASILKAIKETLDLNPEKMDLVDLTNIKIDDQKIPLFVFSISDISTEMLSIQDESITWEQSSVVRNVLNRYQVTGVPFFE